MTVWLFIYNFPDLSIGRLLWDRKSKQDFSTPSQALFSGGHEQNVPCCLHELLVNFRQESSGTGRFCRLEVQTDGQLAQFHFF